MNSRNEKRIAFVQKVIGSNYKGLITDDEMWQEILEIAMFGLNDAKEPLGINEGIAR